jgi:hypothetical protein
MWGRRMRDQRTQIREQEKLLSALEWAREKLGFEADALQARVLNSTSKRVILNCSRQWGKSTVTAAKAVHHASTVGESTTLVISPCARQSGEFVRKVRRFVRQLGIPVKSDGGKDISVLFPNGSRVVGLPGKEETIRGYSAVSLLLVDEASRVQDELYLAVRPMLATSGGGVWLMSTPFGARGFFWETWTRGGPEWERVKATAAECSRIQTEHLEEDRRTMGDRYFRQEYCCEFMDAEGYVFSREDIERAINPDLEPLRFDKQW